MTETRFDFKFYRDKDRVRVVLEGVEVMHVVLSPANLANALFVRLSVTEPFLRMTDEQRSLIYAQLKERLAKNGLELQDDQIYQLEGRALRQMELHFIKQSVESAAERVNENLTKIVEMVCDKMIQAAFFAGANNLREILEAPQEKYSAREIRDAIFKNDWQLLKPIVGVTIGGARNVKHVWTDNDRRCLTENYERLKPVWLEAKRIAKAAQNASERSRIKRWAEAVAATYPELESDLISRLAPDSSDARPADIALTHASRICIPGKSFTTRTLRAEIQKWKSKTSA